MKIPLLALILQGIPEQIAVAALAFVLAKIPLNWKVIIPFGAFLAVSAYIMRTFLFVYGIHTIVLVLLLVIGLIIVGKTNLISAVISGLVAFLCLVIAEAAWFSVLMPLFHITPAMLLEGWVIRTLIGWPQVLTLFGIAFVIYKVRNKKDISSLSEGGK